MGENSLPVTAGYTRRVATGIYKRTEEHKQKISNSLLGNKNSLGVKQSEETIKKSRIGRKLNGWYKNREVTVAKHRASKVGKKREPFSREWRKKLGDAQRGEKNSHWKGGITPEHTLLRSSIEFSEWRTSVFKRDNYTCLACDKRGVYLEAHHIKRFSDYPELRFDVSNGATLCRFCHNKTKGKEREFMVKGGKFILTNSDIVEGKL